MKNIFLLIIRIVNLFLRIGIFVIGFKLLDLSNRTANTTPFYAGIGFILIGLYFAILGIKGPESMACPLLHGTKRLYNKK